jgi:hypothetical protein
LFYPHIFHLYSSSSHQSKAFLYLFHLFSWISAFLHN